MATLEGPVKAGDVTRYQLRETALILLQVAEEGLGLDEAMQRGAGHRKSSYAPSLGHLVLLCFVTCSFLLCSVESEETGILRGFAVLVHGDTNSCWQFSILCRRS